MVKSIIILGVLVSSLMAESCILKTDNIKGTYFKSLRVHTICLNNTLWVTDGTFLEQVGMYSKWGNAVRCSCPSKIPKKSWF